MTKQQRIDESMTIVDCYDAEGNVCGSGYIQGNATVILTEGNTDISGYIIARPIIKQPKEQDAN